MASQVSRFSDGTPRPEASRCPECPEGVPTLFPSQNGTSRRCPVEVGEGVPCVPVYKTGHRTPGPSGRRARLVIHRCNQHVLVGLDDEPAGLLVRVDPYPLSPAGEVAALTAGRATYYLHRGSLERRNRWTIPGHPPSHQLLVLAEHDCTPIPDTWLQPPAPRPHHAPQQEVTF